MADYVSTVSYWQKQKITSIQELEQKLDHFRILFAYHSGKIENDEITYHDTREIFENGKISNYTGDPRALFEQQNQKLCYEYLKDKIVKGGGADVSGLMSRTDNGVVEEAVTALVLLGFPKAGVQKVVNSILKSEPQMSLENLIKTALKKL